MAAVKAASAAFHESHKRWSGLATSSRCLNFPVDIFKDGPYQPNHCNNERTKK
jgi:hypothetical protein